MADILIIDDQDRTLQLCERAIKGHRFHGPMRTWAAAQARLNSARRPINLVLLDIHFDIEPVDLLGFRSDMSATDIERLKRRQGVEILGALRREHPELPVILMTSQEELTLEEGAERYAAEEYTAFLDDDFVDARALQAQIEGIVAARAAGPSDGPIYWGPGSAMLRVRQRLGVMSRGRLPVVLLGPTGSGKSLIARHFVHERSHRRGRFVAVDLSTLPHELMSAHLFGSVRGAYTGSVTDRTGAFEEADGGTLFLDEVGNLSIEAQKMLLSVLQDGTLTRLGDLRERTVDVKLIVATNEDLAERVRHGTFRADLYMRLNPAAAIVLPSLEERGLDIADLLAFVLKRAVRQPALRDMLEAYREKNGLPVGHVVVHAGAGVPAAEEGVLYLLFPDRALRHLRGHSWPGNLREFAMTVENTVLFALAEMLELPASDRGDVVQVRPRWVKELILHIAERTPETGMTADGWRETVLVRAQDTLNKVSQDIERQLYSSMYRAHSGDFSRMAAMLLDDAEAGRKVQLRFNQLGLKVRELKGQLG
ncbi:MAG: DNA-binding NtrC family response regulator [Myxococcota bacterium]|jgi:DNA-binding NtrC family response regulator